MDDTTGMIRREAWRAHVKTFVFYVVARVGPESCYRPMAIAQHCPGQPCNPDEIDTVIDDIGLAKGIRRIVRTFRSSQVIPVIEDEIKLATHYYCHGQGANLSRFEVYASIEVDPDDTPEIPPHERGKVPEAEIEFPMTSKCLFMALRYGLEPRPQLDVRLLPIGAMFNHHNVGQGLVVMDITLSSKPQYAIYSFRMYWYDWRFDGPATESHGEHEYTAPMNVSRASLREKWAVRRRPIGISDYIRYWYHGRERGRVPADIDSFFQSISLTHSSATDFIWPRNPETPSELRFIQHIWGAPSLADLSIKTLLQNIAEASHFDEAHWQYIRQQPDLKSRLAVQIKASPSWLDPSIASGHVLRLVYAGAKVLDWVAFNLSIEGMHLALQSDDLREATSLSVTLRSRMQPRALLQTILAATATKAGKLDSICLYADPERTNDTDHIRFCELLIELSGHSVDALRLLKSPQTRFYGLTASALRRRPLILPPVPIEHFPVRHLLAKHYMRDTSLSCLTVDPYSYTHFYLGDVPLTPSAIVKGFLRYLTSNWRMADWPVSPWAAWAIGDLTIPVMPEVADNGWEEIIWVSPHCLSACRGLLEPGAWTMVMSFDVPLRDEQLHGTRRTIRYSFLRAAAEIISMPNERRPNSPFRSDQFDSPAVAFLDETAALEDVSEDELNELRINILETLGNTSANCVKHEAAVDLLNEIQQGIQTPLPIRNLNLDQVWQGASDDIITRKFEGYNFYDGMELSEDHLD